MARDMQFKAKTRMYSPTNTNTVLATTLPTAKCLNSLLSSRKNRRHQAQTTVEFSLVLLPFLAILFAIIDYAQIYFYENSMQNGLREACRFATAGRIIQTSALPAYETNLGVVTSRSHSASRRRGSLAQRMHPLLVQFQLRLHRCPDHQHHHLQRPHACRACLRRPDHGNSFSRANVILTQADGNPFQPSLDRAMPTIIFKLPRPTRSPRSRPFSPFSGDIAGIRAE